MDAAEDSARTPVLVGWDGRARAVVVVADRLRPTTVSAVARLRELGLRPVLLTGDNERAALAVARQAGIEADDVFAGVRPDGKAAAIRVLQARGESVVFVGDGVNDAAALAQADLGVAVGTGTDAAIGAADLTLVNGDPEGIADAIALARATMSVIHGNLAWAFGYNVVAIPLRRPRLPQPAVRRDRDVGQLADRRGQQPAAAPLRAEKPRQSATPAESRWSGPSRRRRTEAAR